MADELGIDTLAKLDLAALLRVLERNWQELGLGRHDFSYLKEAQNIRNRHAHHGSEGESSSDYRRDCDTLERLGRALSFDQQFLASLNAEAHETDSKTVSQFSHLSESAFPLGGLVATKNCPEEKLPVLKHFPNERTEDRYQVLQNGEEKEFFESQLIPYRESSSLDECSSAQDLRAKLSSILLKSPSRSSLYSLRSGKIDFVHYQYRPVLKLINSELPRLLIADETGVGKTIEGGLILKELKARTEMESALIVCPKALITEKKWEKEMARFGEKFRSLDGQSLRYCMGQTHLNEEWPSDYAFSILPHSLCDDRLLHGKMRGSRRTEEGLLTLDSPPSFDLLIVDEAHHLRNPHTQLYQVVNQLVQQAKAVVFLTATPIQTSTDNLYNLLHLLRPDLIIDKASFDEMMKPNPMINQAVTLCRAAKTDWQTETLRQLEEISDTSWGQQFVIERPDFQEVCDALSNGDVSDEERIQLAAQIEGFYTFGELINRTRRRDIGKFTTRRASSITTNHTPQQRAFYESLLALILEIYQTRVNAPAGFILSTFSRLASSSIFAVKPLIQRIVGRERIWVSYLRTCLRSLEEQRDEREATESQ